MLLFRVERFDGVCLGYRNRSLSLMTYVQSTVSAFSADGSGWFSTLLYPLVTINAESLGSKLLIRIQN